MNRPVNQSDGTIATQFVDQDDLMTHICDAVREVRRWFFRSTSSKQSVHGSTGSSLTVESDDSKVAASGGRRRGGDSRLVAMIMRWKEKKKKEQEFSCLCVSCIVYRVSCVSSSYTAYTVQ